MVGRGAWDRVNLQDIAGKATPRAKDLPQVRLA